MDTESVKGADLVDKGVTDESYIDKLVDGIDGVDDGGNQSISDASDTIDDILDKEVSTQDRPQDAADDQADEQQAEDRAGSRDDKGQQAEQQAGTENNIHSPIPQNIIKARHDDGSVTLKDGSLIKPGPATRVYMRGLTADRDLKQITQQRDAIHRDLQIAQASLKSYTDAASAYQSSGLNPKQMMNAIGIYQALIKDPKGTLTDLLTQAQAGGITIDGQGNTAALVTAAVNNALSPFIKDRQAVQERRVYDNQMAAAKDKFFRDHPGADVHEEMIGSIALETGASTTQVYNQLRQEFFQYGLDWSKGFYSPENQAIWKSIQNGQTPGTSSKTNPLPNSGRTSAPSNPNTRQIRHREPTVRELLTEVMEEQGFRFD